MLNLSGQIATLKQNNKQVGGLFDWQTTIRMNYTSKEGNKVYQPVKNIDAQSYWLLEKTISNEFIAEFYSLESNQLILMDSGKVVIDFPDLQTLDRRLYAPIQVRWINALD